MVAVLGRVSLAVLNNGNTCNRVCYGPAVYSVGQRAEPMLFDLDTVYR